jgi:hypothetical protein
VGIPALSTRRTPQPTASRINPLQFPCCRSRTATLTAPHVGRWGRRHVTGTRHEGPRGWATDPFRPVRWPCCDRSGTPGPGLAAGWGRTWHQSFPRPGELDAAQGMHGPGDTGPGAVVGVVVIWAAQVPRSAPADDHTPHDDRLSVAGLPYGSLPPRDPRNERATPARRPRWRVCVARVQTRWVLARRLSLRGGHPAWPLVAEQ